MSIEAKVDALMVRVEQIAKHLGVDEKAARDLEQAVAWRIVQTVSWRRKEPPEASVLRLMAMMVPSGGRIRINIPSDMEDQVRGLGACIATLPGFVHCSAFGRCAEYLPPDIHGAWERWVISFV